MKEIYKITENTEKTTIYLPANSEKIGCIVITESRFKTFGAVIVGFHSNFIKALAIKEMIKNIHDYNFQNTSTSAFSLNITDEEDKEAVCEKLENLNLSFMSICPQNLNCNWCMVENVITIINELHTLEKLTNPIKEDLILALGLNGLNLKKAPPLLLTPQDINSIKKDTNTINKDGMLHLTLPVITNRSNLSGSFFNPDNNNYVSHCYDDDLRLENFLKWKYEAKIIALCEQGEYEKAHDFAEKLLTMSGESRGTFEHYPTLAGNNDPMLFLGNHLLEKEENIKYAVTAFEDSNLSKEAFSALGYAILNVDSFKHLETDERYLLALQCFLKSGNKDYTDMCVRHYWNQDTYNKEVPKELEEPLTLSTKCIVRLLDFSRNQHKTIIELENGEKLPGKRLTGEKRKREDNDTDDLMLTQKIRKIELENGEKLPGKRLTGEKRKREDNDTDDLMPTPKIRRS